MKKCSISNCESESLFVGLCSDHLASGIIYADDPKGLADYRARKEYPTTKEEAYANDEESTGGK